jgi:DNA-binding XRE family transcriptional regulator
MTSTNSSRSEFVLDEVDEARVDSKSMFDDSFINTQISRKIKLLRKVNNITQSGLAAALGITFQQVQRYEKNESKITASKLYAIAKFFKIDINFFFNGIESFGSGDGRSKPSDLMEDVASITGYITKRDE